MNDIKERLLTKYKKLYEVDDSFDDVIDFSVETVVQDILIYCNLEEKDYPVQLDNTALLMIKDLLDETNMLLTSEEQADASIKSLTEGDFTITRETKAEAVQKMSQADSFCKKYTRYLNRFRKIAR